MQRSPKVQLPVEIIEKKIYLIRGQRVMLGVDLAELYGVPTKVLNQAVKRNKERFPLDFMFQLDKKEVAILRSQFVTSSFEVANCNLKINQALILPLPNGAEDTIINLLTYGAGMEENYG